MQSFRLLSAILKGKWLLEPNFALTQGSLIAALVNKQTDIEKEDPDLLSAYAVSAEDPNRARYSWYHGFDKAPKNSVAVIRLAGTLMKEDQYCGPAGMATIGEIIKEADQHPNINSIVLHIDSPGGTVDGTEALAQIVKNTQKPIISFVDGLMASAALWIGTSADEIMASTDTDEVGSVGVLLSFADIQPYWEKQGVVFHTITASTSPEKVKMWEDLRDGKYEGYIKDVLDPLDEKFMAAVKQNRPNVTDKHLTGKVFFARDVMDVFVDSLGTLEDAVTRAYELSLPDQEEENNNLNNTSEMKQFEKINTVLGVESLESVDESVSLNEEQLQTIETALAANDQAIADAREAAETERDEAVQARDTAEENLQNAIEAFDAIDETVANAETHAEKAQAIRTLLAAKPGAAPENNAKKEDTKEEPFDGFSAEEKKLIRNL